MHDVALITALYGDYDTFRDPVPQDGDVQYICVTDNPDLTSDVWDMVYWPKPHMKPLLAAKAPKMLPAWHCNARSSVWVDMSVQVMSPTFAVEAAEYAGDGVATWPHPWNETIAKEVKESARQVRYEGQRLTDQVQRFHDAGMPPDTSVRHTAVVARGHNRDTELMGLYWDAEFEWSAADQIGFMYACWRSGVPMRELPLEHAHLMGFRTPPCSDQWVSHHPHLKPYTA
jgi:hypothetical protein